MRLEKALLLAAMTAAIGSMSVFAAFADEAPTDDTVAVEESQKLGWDGSGSTWRYYDENGNLTSGWIKAEGGDGRGAEVWYYIDPTTQLMVYNETRVINGVSYTFGEDGSWVAPIPTAPKGKLSGGSYYNTWSNLRIEQIIGNAHNDVEAEDQLSGDDYASIGSPKLTHDLMMETDFGDLEIYYANMQNKPDMDAAAFAAELGNLEKGKTGQLSEVETVTIANQNYAKIAITRTNSKGKQRVQTYYCRKQEGFMVILSTYCSASDAGAMADIVNSITTAQ